MLHNFKPFCCFVLSLLLAMFAINITEAHTPPQPEPDFDKSLEFIQNRNQWPDEIKFSAQLPGGQLLLLQNKWVYTFMASTYTVASGSHHIASPETTSSGIINAHSYTVSFLKANQKPAITTSNVTPGYRNYFIGNDQKRWATEVPAYRVVQYEELYPGIAVKLYEHQKKLKYDFLLAPKADPARIKMEYSGAEKLFLQDGNLVIKTSVNTVTEQKPFAYQIINSKQQEVPCEFKLVNNVVSFVFPKGYRKKLPLVIDPTLIYSTYTGSVYDNWGFTATYDEAGNLYSGGVVFDYGQPGSFPTSPGAFQINYTQNDLANIAIIKYNPNRPGFSSRVWATYLGGANGVEAPHSMVVNSRNELLILGTTSSTTFPVTSNAFDRFLNPGSRINPLSPNSFDNLNYALGSDLFISKLSVNGNALLASTFLGGSGNDGLLTMQSPLTRNYGDQFRGDITVDANDNVYIASSTSSSNFPVVNGFQPNFRFGATDAVVSKLAPDLASLTWSTFLGGSGADAAYSIQVDSLQNVYVCGGTTSVNLAGTAGAFKPAFSGSPTSPDAVDGFVSKISSNGSTLIRTSYIGASALYDQAYFLQLDAGSNVYLLGQSRDPYPTTSGVYSTSGGRQFIQKLDTDLTTGIFSTRFGTNTEFNISPTAFLVDNCERIFICGWGGLVNRPTTNATNPANNNHYVGGSTAGLPITPNAIQTITDGSDFYLMQLSQNATRLEYATFLGERGGQSGEHVDGGTSRFDKRGFVYAAVCGGCGGSDAFPTTPGAWSRANNSGNCNNAAFKFDFAVSSAIVDAEQTVCALSPPFAVPGASPPGGVWSGTGVTPDGIFTPSPALIGTHVLTYTVTVGSCVSRATKTITIPDTIKVSFSGLENKKYCIYDGLVTLTPSIAGGTFSGPGVVNQTEWSPKAAGGGTHVITYAYRDGNSCVFTATDTVTVEQPVSVSAGPNEGTCLLTDPFQLTGASPPGGFWSGRSVTPSGLFDPASAREGNHILTYSVVAGNCTYSATKIMAVEPAANIRTSLPYPLCDVADSTVAGYTPLRITFKNNFPVGKSYHWDFGDGTTSSDENPEHVYTQGGNYTVSLTTDFGRECVRSYSVSSIKVVQSIVPNIITPNGDNQNDNFIPKVSCVPLTFKLYSRWGNLVYERENYRNEFKGENVSSGIYYYHLRDTEGKSWKGWLEIIK